MGGVRDPSQPWLYRENQTPTPAEYSDTECGPGWLPEMGWSHMVRACRAHDWAFLDYQLGRQYEPKTLEEVDAAFKDTMRKLCEGYAWLHGEPAIVCEVEESLYGWFVDRFSSGYWNNPEAKQEPVLG